MRIEQLPIDRDRLGEGPFWDHRLGVLYWLDHLAPSVRRFNPASGETRSWLLPKKAGCACLTTDETRLIIALSNSFAILDLQNGSCQDIVAVPQPREAVRLSDGRADRAGGFVVGSAVTDLCWPLRIGVYPWIGKIGVNRCRLTRLPSSSTTPSRL